MASTYYLDPVDSSQKSYWGKAKVVEDDKGKHLLSYGSNVCSIDNNNGVHLHTSVDKWDSRTTLKHIRSFLYKFNKPIGSKRELLKMYG